MGLRSFPATFFTRSALQVARDLLGAELITRVNGRKTAGRIVEVEAYSGLRDPAAHSFRGPSPRTEVMFREGGFCYVYFIYGNHFCVNVVTGPEGRGDAVLIRALEPTFGKELMMRRRKARELSQLTSGPGKLCQALGIDRRMNGEHLMSSPVIHLTPGLRYSNREIVRARRIGISKATEKLWRLYVRDNEFISRT